MAGADNHKDAAPAHVSILGLGPSVDCYLDVTKRLGGRHVLCDEVWAINALGSIIQCDRIFHMDSVLIQQIRAAALPQSNIARMLEWMRTTTVPIYTSHLHPDYPSLVEYPLQAVIRDCGIAYINNTAAAAVAFANYIGVKQISMWGCDYTYPNMQDAERGRACTEFHLGITRARGGTIGLPDRTSLMDSVCPADERIYGYDAQHIEITLNPGEPPVVTLTPRDPLPTADEIEKRYDHSANPNPLMRA